MFSFTRQQLSRSLLFILITAVMVGAPISFGVSYKHNDTLSSIRLVSAQDSGNTDTSDDNATGNPFDPTQDTLATASPCNSGFFGTLTDLPCNIGYLFVKALFYDITAWLAALTGGLFDFFMWFTMQAATYQMDFITVGWGIIRDLANIILVVALIYAGAQVLFKLSKGNGKSIVVSVIVAGLLINFSLFFTKIVIDASHIVARVFYNAIVVANDDDQNTIVQKSGYKAVSVALLSNMAPQRILNGTTMEKGISGYTSFFFIVVTIAGIINCILIGMFLSVAIAFIGRTVQLMFSMVLSPIALAGRGLPFISGPYIGFDSWLSDLTKSAFMLPVLLFYIYLAALFIDVNLAVLKDRAAVVTVAQISVWEEILNASVPVIFTAFILWIGKKSALSMAGSVAGMVTGVVNKAVGIAVGTTLTGVAVAGTIAGGAIGKPLGTLGAQIAAKGAARGGFVGGVVSNVGKRIRKTGARAYRGTWDVRNATVAGYQVPAMVGALGTGIALGTASTMSSEKRDKERKEAQEKEKTEQEFWLLKKYRDIISEEEEKKGHAEADKERVKGTKEYQDQLKEARQELADLKAQMKEEEKKHKAERDKLQQMKDQNAEDVKNKKSPTYSETAIKDQEKIVKDQNTKVKNMQGDVAKKEENIENGDFFVSADLKTDKQELGNLETEAREARTAIRSGGTPKRPLKDIQKDIDKKKAQMQEKVNEGKDASYTMWDANNRKSAAEKEIKKAQEEMKREQLIYTSNELKSMQNFWSNLGSMVAGTAISALAGGAAMAMTGMGLGAVGAGGFPAGFMAGTAVGGLNSELGRTVMMGGVAGGAIGTAFGGLGATMGAMNAGFMGGMAYGVASNFKHFMQPEIEAMRNALRDSAAKNKS